MTGDTNRTGRVMGFMGASLLAIGAGGVNAQPSGGDPGTLPPQFLPAVVFNLDDDDKDVLYPYGLASADFLDANGNPGQDGYPEIAVAGAGLDICDFMGASTGCDSEPDPFYYQGQNFITIYHNRGAAVNWSGNDGPDPDDDPDDPHDALVAVQSLSITAASEHMWAMEMVFADVTGENGPDLVLVGSDPDAGSGWRGFLLVYKSLGTGLFDPVPTVIRLPDVELRALVAADLDLDGDIDIAASANDLRGYYGNCPPGAQNVIVVFKNITENGILAFDRLPVVLDTPSGSPSGDIVLADFVSLMPGQPLLDLVTPDPANASVSAITNLGLMNFDPNNADPPGGCDPGYYFISATSGRFGTDLHWDIAAVHTANDDDDLRSYVEILHGNGTGSFLGLCDDPPGYRIAPFLDEGEPLFAHGIDSGDFNGDPYPDLAIAAFYLKFANPPKQSSLTGLVAAISGKSDGTFLTRPDGTCFPFDTLEQQTVNVMAVDLDADGFDDIVAANHTANSTGKFTISVLINGIEVTPIDPP